MGGHGAPSLLWVAKAEYPTLGRLANELPCVQGTVTAAVRWCNRDVRHLHQASVSTQGSC